MPLKTFVGEYKLGTNRGPWGVEIEVSGRLVNWLSYSMTDWQSNWLNWLMKAGEGDQLYRPIRFGKFHLPNHTSAVKEFWTEV